MKKYFLFLFLFALYLFPVYGMKNYDKVLTDRNVIYNQMQEAIRSDTVPFMKKITLLQELIYMDNQIIDEWIPFLHKEVDSLNTVIFAERNNADKEIQTMLYHRNILLYGSAGLSVLLFMFVVFFIISAVKRKRLKKKLVKAQQAERDRDAYKSTLEDKIRECTELMAENVELENRFSRMESDLRQKLNEADQVMLGANVEIQNFQDKNQTLRNEIAVLKNDNELNLQKYSELDSLNKAVMKSLEDEKARVAEYKALISREREESIKKMKEQELLLDEMRMEIHELKTVLDEKERDKHHQHFSQVSDVMDENSRLKSVIDEQKEVINEYRITLEKELETRREFEGILKDLLKKYI